MYTCASCTIHACYTHELDKMPKNCPLRNVDLVKETRQKYEEPENKEFYVTASEIEALGYCEWVRLKETMVLADMMHYHKLGLAFCKGLQKEAKIVNDLLRRHGFEVVSVICKAGGVPKEDVGIRKELKLRPEEFEPMCNPILQAELLNEQGTEFNILLGLCVGHDSMFYKYSKALVTTLVVKDRVLAHNPVGAIYCADGYMKRKLD